jgi:hypothetical protein
MAQRFFFEGLDFTMAVRACRILMIEKHYHADCRRLIYAPTQRLLKRIAILMPNAITCIHGPPYSYEGFAGLSADVYMITPFKTVVYLATVVSKVHAEFVFAWYQETFQVALKSLREAYEKRQARTTQEKIEMFRQKLDLVKKRGAMAILHERIGCKVPVDSDKLNTEALAKGVRRYFQAFVPQLEKTEIRWMPEETAQLLLNFIREKAGQHAIHQTPEELREIVIRDW